DAMRRAFTQVRNGRPRPVMVEIPTDVMAEDVPEPMNYAPVPCARYAPDPTALAEVADLLVKAERPVIYAGQGVHYARAWDALRELAELLEAPVTSSLEGKSAFPENHPLSLGSGSRAVPKPVRHFLDQADVVFGIGCSFATTNYGVRLPRNGPKYIQATLDPADLNRELPIENALLGAADLTLRALMAELRDRLKGQSRGRANATSSEITRIPEEWLNEWKPRHTFDGAPLSPSRVI